LGNRPICWVNFGGRCLCLHGPQLGQWVVSTSSSGRTSLPIWMRCGAPGSSGRIEKEGLLAA
jgi:hypothetical protein